MTADRRYLMKPINQECVPPKWGRNRRQKSSHTDRLERVQVESSAKTNDFNSCTSSNHSFICLYVTNGNGHVRLDKYSRLHCVSVSHETFINISFATINTPTVLLSLRSILITHACVRLLDYSPVFTSVNKYASSEFWQTTIFWTIVFKDDFRLPQYTCTCYPQLWWTIEHTKYATKPLCFNALS